MDRLKHLIRIVPKSELSPGKIKFCAYDLNGSIYGNIRIGRFIGKPILYTNWFTVLICKNWQK
ncbi:MAG: hypothetical protein K6U74_02420 [Firmicutes bacterium]|nr:hypothetical protein [Bacillota bacterium]